MTKRDRMKDALASVLCHAHILANCELELLKAVERAKRLGLSREAIEEAKLGRIDYRDLPEEKTPRSGGTDFHRKGGRARVAKLTPEQRSAMARKAAEARWRK